MLVVETIAKIRRAYFVQKKAIKEICRELKVSRKVVRRVVRGGATEFVYERKVQPQPKIGPWREELDRLLAVNAARASRERLTLIRIFEELRGLGYEGGYDAVRRYAAGWQRERATATAAAFVQLSFAPGEAYQFDWSHEVVLIAGTTVTVKVAQVRLCHSRMLFVRAYPRESQEMVFDAHDRAFAFFKGACTRGIYDSMKTAVDAILVGKARDYNRRFQQMCGHYLVEPVACTPAAGWEKGQVENQVGTVRQRFFSPRVRVRSYDELNTWLVDRCVAWAKAQPHPEVRDLTIWQMFEAERPSLVPYAGPFDGFRATPVSPTKTCLVRFDNNKYSVMASAAGRPVEVRAYADRIELRQDGWIVGQHPRVFGRGQTVYDPWHYVPVLARKPGALRNGAPFQDWVLPGALKRVRRKLKTRTRRRPADGRGARRRAERWPAGGGGRLRRGAEGGRPLSGCHPQHPFPAPRPRTAGDDHDPGGAAAAARARRRLRPLRQPEEGERMMERSAIMTTMGELKLFGMRSAYDEIVITAVKRQHEPQRVVSDLLTAELSEKL